MTLQQLDEYINNKILQNEYYIVFTFYEIRVKLNLSSNDSLNFLHLARIKLENNNYKIYVQGQEYYYRGIKKVKDNELMVAIKEMEIRKEKDKI